MFHNDGVGLSANQIGIWERAFVMMTDIDLQETITCFNPRILKQSRKKVIMQEGCLSYPDLFLDIERPESVVVKYEDEGKEIHKVKFEGFIARIFQHEFEHLEGGNFLEGVSRLALDNARRKQRNLLRRVKREVQGRSKHGTGRKR